MSTPRFHENVAFTKDARLESDVLHFQLMKGGHEFHIANMHRFGAFMAFELGSQVVKPRRTLPLLVNSAIGRLFDLITHKRYIFWVIWNHIGYLSWRAHRLSEAMTTAKADDMPPIPDHISTSIASRYGGFEYCRYFEYGGRYLFKVYWVVLETSGQILIAEETDYWIGRRGKFLDVTLSPP